MSATLKASATPGSVTAFILMGDGGDEIDFEWIGGAPNQVQYVSAAYKKIFSNLIGLCVYD